MGIIQEMREVCQQRRLNAKGKMVWAGHWFNTLFVRHFSIYITWLFVKMGISANAVTFLMIPMALIGVALSVPHVLWVNILGFFLLILAEVFDCVDGEIARWMKKSSLKGLYLDLVSHVLCNAPLSIMCALHLYVLNGQIRYMILAFFAYAGAESRLGLKGIYDRLSLEGSSDEKTGPSGSVASGSVLQKGLSEGLTTLILAKRLLYLFTDNSVIRLTSFVGILLSYAGIIEPLIFFAWFFAIFWVFRVICEIANKYFFLVPDMQHVKKV